MKKQDVPPTKLLNDMRKQFSYSLFLFMLTVGIAVTLATGSIERLTQRHVATILIIYSVLQASVYMTFIRQSKQLKKHLKQEE